jgi:acyl-CoA dehydrogenase
VDNFPSTPVRWLMRLCCLPLGRRYRPASDALARRAVQAAMEPGEVRDRLTRDVFISRDASDATGILEHTLVRVVAAEEALRKVERAVRKGEVHRYHGRDWLAEAEAKGVLTAAERAQVAEVEALTARVIAVDHFDPREVVPNYRVISNTTTVPNPIAAE